MLKFFNTKWDDVPTVWIDTETTGVRPGHDRAVQIGIARFEAGRLVGAFAYPVNPGIPIPPEATAIHGFRDEDVRGMPTIEQCFARADVQELLVGAQPAAYNAAFDRHFVPPFGEDWTWPWADSLSIIRVIDRFERGKGRHRLEIACARHGVTLAAAHSAGADSQAAGELFYRIVPKLNIAEEGDLTLGMLLGWQREQEAQEWWRFTSWLSRQPPREAVSP